MAVGTHSSEDMTNPIVSRRPQDDRIADNIVTALELSIPVDVGSVDVRVNRGEVALSGTVSSLFSFRMAQRIAERTPGVSAVDNDLEIR